MQPSDKQAIDQIRLATGVRLGLRSWAGESESIEQFAIHDTLCMIRIRTFDVKSLVREDQFNKSGIRVILITKVGGSWDIDTDATSWDEAFTPYVYEKGVRRKTVEEFTESREWAKLCHRPGSTATPLDSYDRVLDPYFRSTDQMEKYW